MSEQLAGRALDAMIDEKVFGCKGVKVDPSHVWVALRPLTDREQAILNSSAGNIPIIDFYPVSNYSTDLKDAWRVVEHLSDHFDHFQILIEGRIDYVCAEFGVKGEISSGYGRSVPQSICLAALQFVDTTNGLWRDGGNDRDRG